MFDVKLYKNLSESIAVNKELVPVITLTGGLKDGTSIIDPTIIFEGNMGLIASANYMYIEQFGRYYFVNDIVSVRNNLTELRCHVDVLTSFKDGILENDAIILRQENKYNLYLDDGSIKAYQNPKVTTLNFPSGFDGQSFILAVSGS